MNNLLGVKLVAIWEAFVGLLFLLVGLVAIGLGLYTALTGSNALSLSRDIGGAGSDIGGQIIVVAVLLIVLALITIAVGGFFFLVARGLWRYKKWAWIAALIINILNIFFGLGNIATTLFASGEAVVLPLLSATFGIIIAVAIIIYLILPNVRKAFFSPAM